MFMLITTLISCSPSIEGSRTLLITVTPVYGKSPRGIRPLPNTENDGDRIEEEIRHLAEGSGSVFESWRFVEEDGYLVKRGSSQAYAPDMILSLIRTLDTDDDDLVIFFFSGHGTASGGRSYLLADPEYDDDALLAVSDIREAMREIKGTKCILLDACGSGAEADIGNDIFKGEVFSDGFLQGTYITEAIKDSFTLSSSAEDIYILAACTEDQEALDSFSTGLPEMEKHGYFTYCLLGAMGYDFYRCTPGFPPGGTVTFFSLLSGVKERMDRTIWERQTAQATLKALDAVLFSFF